MDLLDRLGELAAVSSALIVGGALDENVVREEKDPLAKKLVSLVPIAGDEIGRRDPVVPSACLCIVASSLVDDVRRFEDALVDLIISVMYFLAFGMALVLSPLKLTGG